MDVAFAADRRRVAEPSGDAFNSSAKIAFGLGGAVEALKFTESYCRQNRACPGAEVFRGNILSGDFPQVVVDVGRCDVPAISLLVDILDELLARVSAPV